MSFFQDFLGEDYPPKNLEIAGDLHVGARKTLILAQMLCEQLIPTFIGLVMAYSALFILIGTMNPTPSDSLAIFLLELHDGLPVAVRHGHGNGDRSHTDS